ncbi:hypothetical protein EMCRGX_G013822 [Ephydatia muelleri]
MLTRFQNPVTKTKHKDKSCNSADKNMENPDKSECGSSRDQNPVTKLESSTTSDFALWFSNMQQDNRTLLQKLCDWWHGR